MVFAGHNLIAENGSMLAESALFSSGLLAVEVDARRLLHERRRMNTFQDEGDGYTRIPFAFDGPCETADFAFTRYIDPRPFVPSAALDLAKRCEEVFSIQTVGLAKRLSHIGSATAVLGLSGGLDSTLALLVAVRAFDKLGLDRAGIKAVGMPGFGTTKRTKGNAEKLAASLGVTYEEIHINKAVQQHFRDIGQNAETLDITYENSQARERTQILMDRANMVNGIVIGTGDLSELALGWATYNGDHMSMYAVNSSVPKTLVRHLVGYCASQPESFIGDDAHETSDESPDERAARKAFSKILTSIFETPVSPELLPPENGEISQRTEHIVGPYELHDFFLYYLTRWGASPAKILFLAERAFGDAYERKEILRWMNVFYRRFFSQQFKRSCLPDGPKVGSVTLSPRSDWRMPSDASSAVWMKELESLD
jgi:NAD+ synthase (glutamine-hydrolysing)